METKIDARLFEQSLSEGQEMMTVKEAGRRGGLTTLAKYGTSHFRRAGAIGGRVSAIRHRVPKEVPSGLTDKRIGEKAPDILYELQPASSTGRVTSRQESGRKGGLSTVIKYGREHMSSIGKLGGRPTFEEALERAKNARLQCSGRASEEGGIGAPP